MTDIFLRIAERALGLAPTVQPMVAPLYAPMPYDEPLEVVAESEIDREGSHTTDVRVTSDMSIGNSYTASNAPVSRNTDRAGIPPVANQTQLLPHERNASALLHSEQETQRVQPTHLTPSAKSQASNATHMNAVEPVTASHTNLAEPVTITHVNERIIFPPILKQESVQAESPSSPASSSRLPGSSVVPQPMSAVRQQATPPGAANMPYSRRAPLQHDGQEKKASTRAAQHTNETRWEIEQSAPTVPTVHVTIGRIEVRASTAPNSQASAQRQSTAPKTMSLAEYLQQNGKGGRS